jgi:hypothetical protein
MDNFTKLLKREKFGQLVLSVLFAIYIIMGNNVPRQVSNVVNTIYGKLILILISILLLFCNPILGAIGFFVVFDLISRSSNYNDYSGSYVPNDSTTSYHPLNLSKPGSLLGSFDDMDINSLNNYVPSEEKKSSQYNAFNQFSYTLEQEVVKQMAPIIDSDPGVNTASYKPQLDNLYNATPVIDTF